MLKYFKKHICLRHEFKEFNKNQNSISGCNSQFIYMEENEV